ncbi:hypothetical protein PINS_up007887 [Pythium insidiosum]|nr:hypothetical protein PINS_up007887 [Pythium insidiosum]
MARQLRALFRQADLRGDGVLTWETFSSFASQTSDLTTALEDTLINRYQSDAAPSPINHAAEVTNMFFLPEVEQMVIHDSRAKGFHVYDVQTGDIRHANVDAKRFQLLDAVYTPLGRYIITATTSPVLSFYDVDHLKIRQQLPVETLQTALTLHSSQTPILYSASATGQVHAWDLQSLRHRHAFFSRHDDPERVMTDIEMIESMGALASASMDGNIYLLDLLTDKVTRTMRGHRKGVAILRYCAENRYLLSAGLDHSVQVWNPHLEQNVGSLPGHRHQLIGMDVRPGTPEIITADESGIIKIWDLRKFAAVQTIVRELYVKEHSTSTSRTARGRPLRAMCYVSSHQRIAVAHSTIFFLDARQGRNVEDSRNEAAPITTRSAGDDADVEEKPLAIFYCSPSQAFVVITATHMQHWTLATTRQVSPDGHAVPVAVPGRVTSAVSVDNLFSCILGCDDGTIARAMMPSGTIVSANKLHSSEVIAVRSLSTLKVVVSSDTGGAIFVSEWDTLQLLHRLDHWRAVQNSRGVDLPLPRAALSPAFDTVYSVPLRLRAFFIGNELERLKFAFASEDPRCQGRIPLSRLPSALHRAFPLSSHGSHDINCVGDDCASALSGEQSITFSMFLELLKDSLTARSEKGDRRHGALAEISSLDTNVQNDFMISASSSDGTFCVWNLRNRAVVAQGAVSEAGEAQRRSIAHIQFLAPSPCFIIVEESSAMLSVWCSVAVPPWLPFPHDCLVRVQHPHKCELHDDQSDEERHVKFITEPEDSSAHGVVGGTSASVIRSTDWIYCSDNDATLCVGDDDGFISLYYLSSLLDHVKTLAASRSANQEDDPPSTTEQSPWISLVKLTHRWQASDRGGCVRIVRLVAIPDVHQPRKDDHVVVLSVVDSAHSVDLWSRSSMRLGRLSMHPLAGIAASDRLWRLRWDRDSTRQREHVETTEFLQAIGAVGSMPIEKPGIVGDTGKFDSRDEEESDDSGQVEKVPHKTRLEGARNTIAAPPRRVSLFQGHTRANPRAASRWLSASARFPSSTSSSTRTEDALIASRRPTGVQGTGNATRNNSQRSLLH